MAPYFVADPFSHYGVAWIDPRGRRGIITRLLTDKGEDTWNIRRASSALVYVAEATDGQWYGVHFEAADTERLALGTA